MRVLDRERERCAGLIAVQGTVAWSAQPARALARPVLGPALAGHGRAGLVPRVALTARAKIFASCKAFEAEAFICKTNGTIRIAFTGRDGVAHSRNEHVTHLDLAD